MASIAQAIRLALHYAEQELGLRNTFGQDVGPPLGGAFTVTQGLRSAWNTPLDERGVIGTAAGLAMLGETSVCEIQFGDYLLNSIDLLRLIGNTCWATRGQFPMPLVLMTPVGAGCQGGMYHSHSLESLLTHLPGWKIVMPSNARDAYGLMIGALLDGNPVAYLIPKAICLRPDAPLDGEPPDLRQRINAPLSGREHWTPDWPDIQPLVTPLGKARLVRRGDRLTLVSYGRMLDVARQTLWEAPEQFAGVELIDLRSLVPWDREMVVASVRKTGRLLVFNEDGEQTNFGEHLLRMVMEEASPRAAQLLAARHLPGIGLSQPLEAYTIPGPEDLRRRLLHMLES